MCFLSPLDSEEHGLSYLWQYTCQFFWRGRDPLCWGSQAQEAVARVSLWTFIAKPIPNVDREINSHWWYNSLSLTMLKKKKIQKYHIKLYTTMKIPNGQMNIWPGPDDNFCMHLQTWTNSLDTWRLTSERWYPFFYGFLFVFPVIGYEDNLQLILCWHILQMFIVPFCSYSDGSIIPVIRIFSL